MASVINAPSKTPTILQRIIPILVLLGIALLVASSCVVRVGAAEVGIRVKLTGSDRGVGNIPIVTGWVFYNRVAEQVIIFPTSIHTTIWTQDVREGSPVDESITFSSTEGVNVNADVALSFHIVPEKAPNIYMRFRKRTLEELADGYIRNAVRDSFNVVASQHTVDHIYGAGKIEFMNKVRKRLEEKLEPDGFVVDQLTFAGALRLPDNVITAINRAMEATQLAIQAENRVRQVKAEAEQAITKAEGEASAARARARGEADAKLIRAKAEARANLLARASTTAKVLQYKAIERWNGKLPLMNGGNAFPMLTLDATQMGNLSEDDEKLAALFGLKDEAKAEPAPAADEKKPAPATSP